jgi:hypothetical protein
MFIRPIRRLFEPDEQWSVPRLLALKETIDLDLVKNVDFIFLDRLICLLDDSTDTTGKFNKQGLM